MGSSEGGPGGDRSRASAVVRAGVVLGIGLGAFFDGIVLHQLLQWHHLLSSHPDPGVATDLRLNVRWDGVFHAVAYAFTVAGVALLWRASRLDAGRVAGHTLTGAVLVGWGLFNLVEGVVDHHLLGVHHVWPAGPGGVVVWDAAFLAWGAAMAGVGYLVIRRGAPPSTGDEGGD